MSRQHLFYTTMQRYIASERIYHKKGFTVERKYKGVKLLYWHMCQYNNLTPLYLYSNQATFVSATTRSISFLRRMRSAPTTRPTSEPFLKMIKVGMPWTRRRDGV